MSSHGGVVSVGELGGCGVNGGVGFGTVGVVGGAGLAGGAWLVGGCGAGLTGDGLAGAGVGGCGRITDNNCDTVSLAVSVAVIVIWFPPILRGTAGMFQFAEPEAVPVRPVLVLQVIRAGPVPPAVVPEKVTEEAVVVSGGFCIVRNRGRDGGGGVCAGVEPSRVPYIA